VSLRLSNKKVSLVFTDQVLASQIFPMYSILLLAKNDPRAKEEFFRAVLSSGATEIWVDVREREELEPTQYIPTQQALDYILSLKNQSACL
jgi:hypothetical protein